MHWDIPYGGIITILMYVIFFPLPLMMMMMMMMMQGDINISEQYAASNRDEVCKVREIYSLYGLWPCFRESHRGTSDQGVWKTLILFSERDG
jgi:hypothetical protein